MAVDKSIKIETLPVSRKSHCNNNKTIKKSRVETITDFTGRDELVENPEREIPEGDEQLDRMPRAVSARFTELLKSLRSMSGVTKRTSEELETVLASSDLGIGVADVALRGAKTSKSTHGYLKVNGVPVNRLQGYMRAGSLVDMLRATGKNVHVSEAESNMFGSLVKDLPENALKNIEDMVRMSVKDRPHLNVTMNNYATLSETAKTEISSFYDNLIKFAKTGTYLALVIGGVTIGANWLINGLADRRGCWMVRTVNGKTTSCRVTSFSCGRQTDRPPVTGGEVKSTQTSCTDDLSSYYNTTLSFIHICELDDTDVDKLNLSRALGVSVDALIKNKASILNTKFENINNFVKTYTGNSNVNVCKQNADIDGGKVPYCRMCDPSADPRSTQYIDTSSFIWENVTFKCIENPTVLELMSDVVHSTGTNLWEAITSVPSTLFKTFKYVGIFTALALICSVIYLIYRKFIFKTVNPIYNAASYESLRTVS